MGTGYVQGGNIVANLGTPDMASNIAGDSSSPDLSVLPMSVAISLTTKEPPRVAWRSWMPPLGRWILRLAQRQASAQTASWQRSVDKSASALAKLDASSGTLDASFGLQDGDGSGVGGIVAPNPPTINSILVNAGTVWLGGRFTVYGGYSVNNLVKLDDTTLAIDTTFSPAGNNGFDAPVSALAAAGSALYVGGSFTAYRGATSSTRRLAKLDVTTGALDTTFSPPGATANGIDNTVQALAVSGASLDAGGSFTAYRGSAESTSGLAKIDLSSGALDAASSSAASRGFDGAVNALAVSRMLVEAFAATKAQSHCPAHWSCLTR
jgi:hypothetical protein